MILNMCAAKSGIWQDRILSIRQISENQSDSDSESVTPLMPSQLTLSHVPTCRLLSFTPTTNIQK